MRGKITKNQSKVFANKLRDSCFDVFATGNFDLSISEISEVLYVLFNSTNCKYELKLLYDKFRLEE